MNKKAFVIGLLVFALAAVFNFTATAQSEKIISMRGKVKSVKQLKSKEKENPLGTIFVERVKESDSKIGEAYLLATEKTQVFIQEGDTQREAAFRDIKKGDIVQALYTDAPMIMIYPARIEVKEIVILRKGAKPMPDKTKKTN